LSNAGWGPYSLNDTNHNWWNVESGNVRFNLSGSVLNYVSFYSRANRAGGLLGTVLASDLYSNFSGITNTTDPGYMISFVPGSLGSVVFGTGPSDFEFAVVGPLHLAVAGVPHRLGRCPLAA
jgi:hypothetical protein